jgi:recombination protein RecA
VATRKEKVAQDDRRALIVSAAAAVKKAHKGSISDVASAALEYPTVFASTGALSLDRLCAGLNPGGVPIGEHYGCIVHIAGEWSTGKTLVLDQMFLDVLVRLGGLAKRTETEGTASPHFPEAIGVPMDLLSIDRPDSFEQAWDMFESWHTDVRKQDKKIPVLWGFDSLDSTEADKSAGKGLGESGGWHFGGGRAEVLGAILRRMARLCSRYPTTLVMLNQTRDNVGVMFGPKKRTPGGNPPHFYASLEIWLSGSTGRGGKGFVRANTSLPKFDQKTMKHLGLYDIEDAGAVVGRYIRAKCTKTKVGTTLDTSAEFYLDFRRGMHRWEGLVERLVLEGLVRTNKDMSEFEVTDRATGEVVKMESKKACLNYLAGHLDALALNPAEAVEPEAQSPASESAA